MNVKNIAVILAELSLMKFFPADDSARAALLGIVLDMAHSEAEVRWLVDRMLSLYNEWPGPREMRACFCQRFPPKDGINAYSSIYIADEGGGGGFPPLGIAARQPLRIAEAPMCEESKAVIQGLAASLPEMPKAKPFARGSRAAAFAKLLEETITAPCDRPNARKPEDR